MDFVGIDVGKAELHLVLLQGDKKPTRKVVNNEKKGFEQILAWFENRKAISAHVCLEATGVYGEAVAEFLHDSGFTVSVVNPMQIKAFGTSRGVRTKTDKVDALIIAEFCKAMHPHRWEPPAPEIRHLRALVRRRETLVDMVSAETNRLEGALDDDIRRSISDHIKFLENALERLMNEIKDHIDGNPDLRELVDRMDGLPGFGFITAIKVIAETSAFSVCATAKQLVAYAGINPRIYQSANDLRRGGISKIGNAALRKALYHAALTAKRSSAYFRPFVLRLEAAGKRPKVIITAIMRKLLVLAHTLATKGTQFDPAHA